MALDIQQHKNLLTRILKDIFNNKNIAQHLGFKGGTAALFFYGLNRFSVDLDFDLLNEDKSDLVFTELQEILMHYGTIKEAREKRYSLLFIISYESPIKDAQNIKIEINKRNFGSRYEVKQYLGISMLVMVQEDIVANKLVALYERIGKTNRDIYDAWFFLQNNWPVNKKIVELRTHMTYQEFLQKCIDLLEHMSNRNILSGIGELLTEKQKSWAKANLKNETIFLLRLAKEN